MSGTFYLQAMNVHVGGGRSLLIPLLEAIAPGQPVVALLDQRMALPPNLPANLIVRRVAPTPLSRWRAERWLKQQVAAQDTVLCFGNLPPLAALKGRVFVFVQNRFLIEKVSLSSFRLKTRLRLALERLWLFGFARHATDFIVQTPSMRRLLADKLGVNELLVQVWPFAAVQKKSKNKAAAPTLPLPTAPDELPGFIYPASGDPHKNHKRLIDAWAILAASRIFPPLYLTLDTVAYPELSAWIDARVNNLNLNIINLGFIPQSELLDYYSKAKALIYPSLLESFGLPLMEAAEAGLAVLAPEMDYVRDILDPTEVFDPLSSVSIARAVNRFIGMPADGIALLDAKTFLDRVLKRQA
jgi:glycosyltransferase involved in cell wall biosynthesis